MIHSADTHLASLARHAGIPPDRMAEASLHPRFWYGIAPQPVPGIAAASLPVRCNDGRWVIQCPSCLSAQLASKVDRRFYCGECGNADHGGQWVKVLWPVDVDDIETVLNARPAVASRNWRHDNGDGRPETVADLIIENDLRNIPTSVTLRLKHGVT